MEMSLNALSARMGGSPGAPFISKIESGIVHPTREVTARLAKALEMPREDVLNAAGFATETQQTTAIEVLRGMQFSEAPVMVSVPVYNETGPTGARRPRLLRHRADARIVDLDGPVHGPFQGEVMYDPGRPPIDGVGVVAAHEGVMGAWTYHTGPRDTVWLENGRGEKITKGFEIHGTIIRVTQELNLE
jgi:hypothetical protein